VKTRRLDDIDLKILAALQAEGRITNQALSERVGLSARPCLERVRRLEQAGFIRRYMAVLDASLLPKMVTVFAEVALREQGQRFHSAFERRVLESPEVVDCYMVSGQFDYLAQVVCPTLERYRDLTGSWLDDPDLGVARIVSSIVLRPVRSFSGYPLDLLTD
jgi:DNA-binding Lrp family transcriptional regulator